MSTLVESLKRLYQLKKLTYEQISGLAEKGKISWEEVEYITKADEV